MYIFDLLFFRKYIYNNISTMYCIVYLFLYIFALTCYMLNIVVNIL